MPRREHQQTKRLIQQRQEQQRDRPSSTAKTSGGGVEGQQDERRPIIQSFTGFRPVTEFSFTAPSTASIPFPAQYPCDATPPGLRDRLGDIGNPITAPARDMGIPISAPTPAQVGEEVAPLLAPLPKHGEALSPAQEAALDLLAQLAGGLAHRITDPASVHALIDRLPDLGTGCGRAVANALREAQ